MSKPERVYWDACAWISYINKELNIPKKDGGHCNRYAMCRGILEKAESSDGKFEIVTSAFSLAEVYQRSTTEQSGLSQFPAFLEQPFILTIPVDMAVGQKAHSMLSSGLIGLRPPDAIHLASALRAGCKEMHTFDKQILQHNNIVPINDTEKLRICPPGEIDDTGTLFEGHNG